MKNLIGAFVCVLGVCVSNVAISSEARSVFNSSQESIQLPENGTLSLIRPGKLPESIILIKSLDEESDISSLEEDDMHADAVQFFYTFLRNYTLETFDKTMIAYGILKDGHGFVGDNIYSIEVSELMKANNRDFGSKDMRNKDNGMEIVPVRNILESAVVLSANSLSNNDVKTRNFREVVREFRFGAGLVESYIEADHSTSASESKVSGWVAISEDVDTYGNTSFILRCNSGPTVVIVKSGDVYSYSSGSAFDFQEAATSACEK